MEVVEGDVGVKSILRRRAAIAVACLRLHRLRSCIGSLADYTNH